MIQQLPRETFHDGLTWIPEDADDNISGNKNNKEKEDAIIHLPESILDFLQG